MIQDVVRVENRMGLHARAAARLVRLASRFSSTIRLSREGSHQGIDAKSILGVLMMAATQGTQVTVSAEGQDEREACQAICDLFRNKLGEEN
jgi:phosphocarrier protein HPr